MSSTTSIEDLIGLSYGQDEKARFLGFTVTEKELETAVKVGETLLQRASNHPGACAHLSAIWTLALRERFQLPAYCVAGGLCVRGKLEFGGIYPTAASRLDVSCDRWDAHCWVALGHYVADLSVFRTAKAEPCGSTLKEAVLDALKPGQEVFLMTYSQALCAGFEYTPKHVATEAEIEAIIRGARATGKL